MASNQVEKKIVAITGGIGSGKSTLLEILKKKGYFVISSDQIVKDIYKKRWFLREIKKLFPNAVKGFLCLRADKKVIADEVFRNSEKRQKLNLLVHPTVMREGLKQLRNNGKELSFMEVPLLFEGGYENQFDKVIVVNRGLEERIESVKFRSGLTREEILERINAQIDYETTDFSKYILIKNDKSKDELSLEIERILETL